MIVMPFSRSRSMESIIRSGTASFSRKRPDCQSIASTSVVLPWSTWAMIATFRMLSRCCITPLYHVGVQCPRCGSQSVRRSSRVGAFERLISVLYVYPFRCQRCTFRFRRLNWGHRYPNSKGDRRDYERVVVRLPARLTAGAESAEAETTDLSISGCAVRTSARFPPGPDVRFILQLCGGPTVGVGGGVVGLVHDGCVSPPFVSAPADAHRR